ncbi:MAG: hypothetical protein HQ538_03645 [Parcubacteria group bacterium]|nr:hypothetical protein [Parcubacteria group bacterium]
MVDFKFDKEDYYKIRGLYRGESDKPFLVPVFFKKECLIRYFYSPEYRCELCSETYGTIYYDGFYISFGINKDGKVIMWLGDLEKLPEDEQIYLLSCNIDSDHEIASEFYDAQINVMFTDPIKEVELLLQKFEINKISGEKLGFKIFQTEQRDIDKILSQCSKYKSILINREDDFKRFISEWNEILIEDISKEGFTKYLKSKNIEVKEGLGAIKLFERLIKEVLNIKENIILPYYVLYDLRLWADHKGCEKYFKYSLERLSLNEKESDNYKLIYDTVIEKIRDFQRKIKKELKEIY